MANRYAIASGNWSNSAIWDGGTLPSTGDIVRANSYSVTIDQNIIVSELRTDASTPAVSGGTFIVSTNRTINANIYGFTTASGCLTFGAGNLTVNINGSINGGTGSQNFGVFMSTYSGITLNIVGNINGGTGNTSSGIHISTGTQTVNVTGDVRAFVGVGILNNVSTTKIFITINGNVYGSTSSTSQGAGGGANTSTELVVYGNVYAGLGSGVSCVNLTTMSNPIIKIYGIAYASTVSGVDVVLSGAVWYVGFVDLNGVQGIKNTGLRFLIDTVSNVNTYTTSINTVKNLYSAGFPTGHASVGNVRSGIVYGPNNELTGTLIVPSVGNVRKGVQVDNTVGVAELTAQDLFDAITSSSDPIATRLRNLATVETTAETIAAYSI